jgi:hypothetical protein
MQISQLRSTYFLLKTQVIYYSSRAHGRSRTFERKIRLQGVYLFVRDNVIGSEFSPDTSLSVLITVRYVPLISTDRHCLPGKWLLNEPPLTRFNVHFLQAWGVLEAFV